MSFCHNVQKSEICCFYTDRISSTYLMLITHLIGWGLFKLVALDVAILAIIFEAISFRFQLSLRLINLILIKPLKILFNLGFTLKLCCSNRRSFTVLFCDY